MSKTCGCLSQEILTHPHIWESRKGQVESGTKSYLLTQVGLMCVWKLHLTNLQVHQWLHYATLMSLKQGIRFSYVFIVSSKYQS